MMEIQIMRNRRILKLIMELQAMEPQQAKERPPPCTTQQGAAEQLAAAMAANLKVDRALQTSITHPNSKMVIKSPNIHMVQKRMDQIL